MDFQVGRVHVLVDGSVHHGKWVREVDHLKRQALHLEGYTIVEFDVEHPDDGIRRIRAGA
jgi:very-short-patch-repair endonuclease